MDIQKAYDIGYVLGAAESLAMDEKAEDFYTLLASDTKEDGFVTLTDKSGKPYVAQFNEGEKERYKETGKKLSQVKKEEKEKQPGQVKTIKDLHELAADINQRLQFDPKFFKRVNNHMLTEKVTEALGRHKDLAELFKNLVKEQNPITHVNKINVMDYAITEYLKEQADKIDSPEIKNFQKEFIDLCKDFKKKSVELENAKDAAELSKEFKDSIDKLHDKHKNLTSDIVGIGYFYNEDMEKQKLAVKNDIERIVSKEREQEKKDNPFRKFSPSGKFFGENGVLKVSNKYFFINHKPDDKTVILDNVADRLRVTGKGDLIFLTDKNKGYFINEKNMLPVLSYNNSDNSHTLNLAVKLNKDYLKEYTFKEDFISTEDLKPITGFEQLQEMAEKKDVPFNRTSYKNVDSKLVDSHKMEYLRNLYSIQKTFRKTKPVETVSTGGKANDIDQYLKGWNQKIYKYKDGTRAIFSNNQKIVLTEEQYNYLKDKAAN